MRPLSSFSNHRQIGNPMENGEVGLQKTVIAILVLALALGAVAFAGYMGVAAAYSRATVARVERDVTYCVVGNLPQDGHLPS